MMIGMSASMVVVLAQASGGAAPSSGVNELVVWALILLGVAATLFVLELFLPSGGLIGFLSALCLVAGIVLLFRVDTGWGITGVIVSLAALPFAIGFMLKIWPNTPIARAMTLRSADPADVDSSAESSAPKPSPLLGQCGKVLTDLRPVGVCLIDGRREQCLAQKGMIQAGTPIRVVAVDGTQIKVAEER